MVVQNVSTGSSDAPKTDRKTPIEDDNKQDGMFTKLLFLNLSSAGVFGDERLLPAIFQELSVAFNASLSQLGALTFAGAISQALSFPLGNPIHVLKTAFPESEFIFGLSFRRSSWGLIPARPRYSYRPYRSVRLDAVASI